MFGFIIGGLAALWGVLLAVLDQPGASPRGRVERVCTALLIACTAAAVTGGVLAATA